MYFYNRIFSGIMNFSSLRTLISHPVCSQRNTMESYGTAAEASVLYSSRLLKKESIDLLKPT